MGPGAKWFAFAALVVLSTAALELRSIHVVSHRHIYEQPLHLPSPAAGDERDNGVSHVLPGDAGTAHATGVPGIDHAGLKPSIDGRGADSLADALSPAAGSHAALTGSPSSAAFNGGAAVSTPSQDPGATADTNIMQGGVEKMQTALRRQGSLIVGLGMGAGKRASDAFAHDHRHATGGSHDRAGADTHKAAGGGKGGHVAGGGDTGRPLGGHGHHPHIHGGQCPPVFAGPNCEDASSQFADAVGNTLFKFQAPYMGDISLTAASIKGQKHVYSSLPPNYEKDILIGQVTPKVLQALPHEDAAFPKPVYNSCAIVGSSGILLNYRHADEIDSHDVVMRFNSAPTKHFESFVGRKTTHRITNSRNFNYHESADEHVFVHLRTASSLRRLVEERGRTRKRMYGIHPQFHRWMDRTFNFLATSGLNGIVIALHKCVHIHLYGFHIHPQHGVFYHYYNKDDVPANADRDDREWLVVRMLVKSGFVSFAEPCVMECHDSNPQVCKNCLTESSHTHKGRHPS
eukprot:jgi/Mesvir1/16691/Mv15087-RA.1